MRARGAAVRRRARVVSGCVGAAVGAAGTAVRGGGAVSSGGPLPGLVRSDGCWH